jgi:hypothetical protein
LQDAQTTPFGFEGLLAGNRALISAGLSADEARSGVLGLANAMAATGGTEDAFQRMIFNLQQIKSIGVATAADVRQFGMAGINIYKVLEAAGIQSGDNTAISYENLAMAFQKAASEGGIFENALQNASKNTSTQISNLGDAMFVLKTQIFEDLKPAITSIIEGIAATVEGMKSMWEWAVQNQTALKAVAGGAIAFGSALLILRGRVIALAAAEAMGAFISALALGNTLMTAATAASAGLGTALTIMLSPLGLITIAVTALGAAYAYLNAEHEKTIRLNEESTKSAYGSALTAQVSDYEAAYKKSGLSRADFIKRENAELEKAFSEQNAITNAALYGPMEGNQIKGKVGDLQSIELKRAALSQLGKAGATTSAITGAASAKPTKDTTKTSAVGSKSVTINVQINDMIKEFNINTTNVTEGANKLKQIITQALTGAVNDFQITAGQ